MSTRIANSADGTENIDSSRSQQSSSQRRQRSRSTSRYTDVEKPKKKRTVPCTTSLVSIPNTIKLSMLNSGLLSFERVKLEARDQNNSLSQTIPDKTIELCHFPKLCEQRRKFRVLYKLEFQTAAKVETNSCRHASRKNNELKNQNQKCIPYDYNRVVLEKIDGLIDSDYVNASYIDSLLKPNAYIVTQGPTEETVNDFWRTVWQEKVSTIIMLTKTFDFTKVMCIQYWPPAQDKTEVYGDIHIGIYKEEQLANFQIRTFRIWKENAENVVTELREIIQFHYTEWHSHTNPFSNAVLEFRRRVRAVVGNIITENSLVGPMLVHCNDGGGRSGVYIAIDANLELAEEEDCFHVFGYLKKLRQARKGLIENVDQYKFVYDTLEEHIKCGRTWFPVAELSERLKAKAQKDPASKMNVYQKEYLEICKQTPRFTIGDCAGGHRADNREKNRDVLCVPPDNFRPYLTSFQGNAFTDYINAVFVDGYTKPREYIVTEWPLKHTVGEFWSLVYDQECSAVVVLCQPPPHSQEFPSFWPEKSKMEKYGPVFSVHLVTKRLFENVKQWEYKINKKIVSLTELMAGVKAPTKVVQLFQLTCFPLGHKVPTSTNSFVALMNMVENWRAKTDYGPVCVVSPDGRSRAGVYCAANACIEQVIQHGEVDVFQAVKTVRRHRPQLIESMTEYKYCYDLLLHYVLHYLNKDLTEKKFIHFGRGKPIPLTPDSSNADLLGEASNAGKVVVTKNITKIVKTGSIQIIDKDENRLVNGRMMQRKKKGRLFSLGGNEPPRRKRGRLDRLKTVGTFDLGIDGALDESSDSNEQNQKKKEDNTMTQHRSRRMSANAIFGRNGTNEEHAAHYQRTSYTPGPCRREIQKTIFAKRMASRDSKLSINSTTSSPSTRRSHSESDKNHSNISSDEIKDQSKLCSSSTNTISSKAGNDSYKNCIAQPRKSPSKHIQTFAKKTDHKEIKHGDNVNTEERSNDAASDNEIVLEKCPYKPRKPVLRKSKRIVRTDSEVFDEMHTISPIDDISSEQITCAQIHNEPEPSECPKSTEIESIASTEMQAQSTEIIDVVGSADNVEPNTLNDEQAKGADTCDIESAACPSDLAEMERDFREFAKSNLQREYKSDGDSLDEVGRKRSDYQSWTNQSFETNFECYGKQNNKNRPSQSIDYMEEADKIEVLEGDESVDHSSISQQCDQDETDRDNGHFTEHEKNQQNIQQSPMNNSNMSVTSNESNDPKPTPDIKQLQAAETTVTKLDHDQPSSILLNSSNNVNKTSPHKRPSKLEIVTDTKTTSAPSMANKEKTIFSLLEKRFGRFTKINKLLKLKTTNPTGITNSAGTPGKPTKKEVKDSTSSTSTQASVQSVIGSGSGGAVPPQADNDSTASQKEANTEQTTRLLKPRSSPGKSSTTDSKSSVYSSKYSLFSSIASKSSIFQKKSAMHSHSSRSNNELNARVSSRTGLTEVSKSNSEINRCRMSPMRNSSKRKNKPVSSTCVYSESEHSPLSEEFYNKTGSVRLSAVELYHKFLLDDFVGLYKQEAVITSSPSQENRRRYARSKDAHLMKQKSEPKFIFRQESTYHDPREEDEDYYIEEELSFEEYELEDEYFDEYEGEENFEGEYDMEDMEMEDEKMDDEEVEEEGEEEEIGGEEEEEEEEEEDDEEEDDDDINIEKDDEQRAYHSESDVDEIFLMPEESKPSDCEYEQYGFENKHFSLEHSRLTSFDYDLSVIDEIPYLDDVHSQYPYIIDEAQEPEEVLTIYRSYSPENVLSDVNEIDETEEDSQPAITLRSSSSSDQIERTKPENSAVELILCKYLKSAPTDISLNASNTNIDSHKSDSLDLSESGTIRSGSTLTGYDFDTVKHLNFESSSASRISLSLKSEGYEDFTLTPDEPRIIRNCEVEDFSLTPEASYSEAAIEPTTADDTCAELNFCEANRSDAMFRPPIGDLNDSISNNDVLEIVDRFLTNERLLQENLNIIPITKTLASPLISPIDSDASLTNILIAKQKGSLFNSQSSSSKSTLDDALDLDKFHLDDNFTADSNNIETNTNKLGETIFHQNADTVQKMMCSVGSSSHILRETNHIQIESRDELQISSTTTIVTRLPTRYSMQKLEPYYFADDESDNKKEPSRSKSPRKLEKGASANVDYCNIVEPNETTLRKKKIFSMLRRKKSQSLENVNKRSTCYPL